MSNSHKIVVTFEEGDEHKGGYANLLEKVKEKGATNITEFEIFRGFSAEVPDDLYSFLKHPSLTDTHSGVKSIEDDGLVTTQ